MYTAGEEEIEAIARVIRSGALFRYGDNSECNRFEARKCVRLVVIGRIHEEAAEARGERLTRQLGWRLPFPHCSHLL